MRLLYVLATLGALAMPSTSFADDCEGACEDWGDAFYACYWILLDDNCGWWEFDY